MVTLIIILLALLLANIPWFSERIFYLIPLRSETKSLGWRLLELVMLYFLMGGIVYLAERSVTGQVAVQHWEFYAVTACLFLVFAFPGFVYRYFWRK